MQLSQKQITQFQKKVYDYYHAHKRDFPWRKNITPYRVVVSEIMLQQTQAPRVIPKFKLFVKTFPNFSSLAKSPLKDVLTVWQGLGYNRRALGLHKLAHIVVSQYSGTLPHTPKELQTLPWIGPHTAGSIAAFAFNHPSVFVETNVRSVYIHEFFGDIHDITDAQLLPYIEASLDHTQPREWYNALMDYGTMLKEVHGNPSRKSAHYIKQSTFLGSNRQLRGIIIAHLTRHGSCTAHTIAKNMAQDFTRAHIAQTLGALEKEGMIKKIGRTYMLC